MRRLLNLLLPQLGKAGLVKYATLSLLSGLWSFLFVNLVTQQISMLIAGEKNGMSKEYALLFTIVILFFIWTRKTLSTAIIGLSQNLFWSLRKKILAIVLKADYQQLMNRKTKIDSAMVSDVNTLTVTSMSLIDFFTSTILAVACLVYLATISVILFSITLAFAIIGILIYQYGTKRNAKSFERARDLEDGFITHFSSIIDGFKEIYIEPKKGKAIYEKKIIPIANEAFANNQKAFTGFLNIQITGQVLFYALIAAILVFFSTALHIKTGETVKFIFTLLYLLSSIETIMALLPGVIRARVASDRLMDLKTELEQAHFKNSVSEQIISKDEFESIQIKELEFKYEEQQKGFGIGPVNFEIQKGETVFIYGGNGSGKTTFIHTLLGIFKPTGGGITVNGMPVKEETYPEYKTLFSVVFSDFYLFNELLTTDQALTEKWDYYIRLFELKDKVKLEGNRFSTTNLSTGQRKRLALIAALLEEKPILVMDEWAADQDPYFRKKFYTELLPVLKEEGYTIIAITHDDKYYHCADKLFKMEEGKLIEETVLVYESNLVS
jgi:putative ATP-binding cassette transporter